MKLPDELLDRFKTPTGVILITYEDMSMLEEAFKAGMLAAADIAYPDNTRHEDEYDTGREAAAIDIREAVTGAQ